MENVTETIAWVSTILLAISSFGWVFSVQSNKASALKNLSDSLDITSDELREALKEAVSLRKERTEREVQSSKREEQFALLQKNYETLKQIARKMYENMLPERRPVLSEKELKLLFDTQELMPKAKK